MLNNVAKRGEFFKTVIQSFKEYQMGKYGFAFLLIQTAKLLVAGF